MINRGLPDRKTYTQQASRISRNTIPSKIYNPEKKTDEEINIKILQAVTSGDDLKLEEIFINYANYNINYVDDKENNFLHVILSKTLIDNDIKLKISKILINKGINYNKTNIYNETPLHYACQYCNFDIVKYLLSLNININNVNNEKMNALHYATLKNNILCPVTVKKYEEFTKNNNNINKIIHFVSTILKTKSYSRYFKGIINTISNVIDKTPLEDEFKSINNKISELIKNYNDKQTLKIKLDEYINFSINSLYNRFKKKIFTDNMIIYDRSKNNFDDLFTQFNNDNDIVTTKIKKNLADNLNLLNDLNTKIKNHNKYLFNILDAVKKLHKIKDDNRLFYSPYQEKYNNDINNINYYYDKSFDNMTLLDIQYTYQDQEQIQDTVVILIDSFISIINNCINNIDTDKNYMIKNFTFILDILSCSFNILLILKYLQTHAIKYDIMFKNNLIEFKNNVIWDFIILRVPKEKKTIKKLKTTIEDNVNKINIKFYEQIYKNFFANVKKIHSSCNKIIQTLNNHYVIKYINYIKNTNFGDNTFNFDHVIKYPIPSLNEINDNIFDDFTVDSINQIRCNIYENYFPKQIDQLYTFYTTDNTINFTTIGQYYPQNFVDINITNEDDYIFDDEANDGYLVYDKNYLNTTSGSSEAFEQLEKCDTTVMYGKIHYVNDELIQGKQQVINYINEDNIDTYIKFIKIFLLEYLKEICDLCDDDDRESIQTLLNTTDTITQDIIEKYKKIKNEVDKNIRGKKIIENEEIHNIIYIMSVKIAEELFTNYISEKVISNIYKKLFEKYSTNTYFQEIYEQFNRLLIDQFYTSFDNSRKNANLMYNNYIINDTSITIIKYKDTIYKENDQKQEPIINKYFPKIYTLQILHNQCNDKSINEITDILIKNNCNINQLNNKNISPIHLHIDRLNHEFFTNIFTNLNVLDKTKYIKYLNESIIKHEIFEINNFNIKLKLPDSYYNNFSKKLNDKKYPEPLFLKNIFNQLIYMLNHLMYYNLLNDNVLKYANFMELMNDIKRKSLLRLLNFKKLRNNSMLETNFNDCVKFVASSELFFIQDLIKKNQEIIDNDLNNLSNLMTTISFVKKEKNKLNMIADGNYYFNLDYLYNSKKINNNLEQREFVTINNFNEEVIKLEKTHRQNGENELLNVNNYVQTNLSLIKNINKFYDDIYNVFDSFYFYNSLWSYYINNMNPNLNKNNSNRIANIHLLLSSYIKINAFNNSTINNNIFKTILKIYKEKFIVNIQNYFYDNSVYDFENKKNYFNNVIDIIVHIIKTNILNNMYLHIINVISENIMATYTKDNYIDAFTSVITYLEKLKKYIIQVIPLNICYKILNFNITNSPKEMKDIDALFNIISEYITILPVRNINIITDHIKAEVFPYYKDLLQTLLPDMKQLIDNYFAFIVNEYKYLLIYQSINY
ncbi:ankyrin repeat protein [Hokovirus HKV1]|uniref:Ankyrin repeat protein n=1 Tax=Hokovirus HKV1 TaxID=1977638 RepID=A0A1V0SFR7_9VIRU|nr:ankyrin repeat protein [Hokovirus HKV1]